MEGKSGYSVAGISFGVGAHALYLPSNKEVRNYDELTIADTPSLELMERAGRGVFSTVVERSSQLLAAGDVVVLCGPGNNGGDGIVFSRRSRRKGFRTITVLAGAERYSPDLLAQLRLLSDEGGEVLLYGMRDLPDKEIRIRSMSIDGVRATLNDASIVVDALLGTGGGGAPKGSVGELISEVNVTRSKRHELSIVAIDIPSGVNSDTGATNTPYITADYTVCIELVKRGLVQYPARAACGDIIVVPIGLTCEEPPEFEALGKASLSGFPRREPDAHKGNFGKVLVVGGSGDMPGAASLAARGALRAGAGYVYRAILGNGSRGDEPPEILFKTIPTRHSYFDEISVDGVVAAAKESSVVILGPGLGRAAATIEFVRSVIRELVGSGIGLVLDADALVAITGDPGVIAGFSDESLVITPHPGEMSRILGITTEEVQLDRYSAAREATKKIGGTVVLKGASSIVYTQRGGFVNLTGNPFMASAGMGDVLAGVIGALMAQGMKGYEAAKLGVFLHASSGDMAYERTGGPIVASDVIDCMPLAIGDLRRGLV